jgi:hypothetical protein
VPIADLIGQGILVPPRTYTTDLGVADELAAIDETAGDYAMTEAATVPFRSREAASARASAWRALGGLPPPGTWVRLVRPDAIEALALLALVLLDRVSGLLVALGGEVARHG